MKILFITLTCLIVLGIVGMLSGNDKVSHFSWELHKGVSIALVVYVIIVFINWSTPTAMDVYQGKTTLEITYRDGVPVDSVVVLKKVKEK